MFRDLNIVLALVLFLFASAFAASAVQDSAIKGRSLSSEPRLRIADATTLPSTVRISTSFSNILKKGDTVVNSLEVTNAAAGQKIRIQNSNHGANYFTTDFASAVRHATAQIPGTTATVVTSQQMEISLAAGSYQIAISQTVTTQSISESVDDASWAPGRQLQVDWLLSSAPVNGAPVESDHAIVSKWITYADVTSSSQPHPADGSWNARWTLLRSIPNIEAGGAVAFEIGETNFTLKTPTSLNISLDPASTASDVDFLESLNESISSSLDEHVSFDATTGKLLFKPGTTFPFRFKMIAKPGSRSGDYIVRISDNEIGEIDVAKAGVRLGSLSFPATSPRLGINEASGEFGIGRYSFKYVYPGKDRIDWAAAQGFSIVRIPFLYQNIQSASGAPLNEIAMRFLDVVIDECATKQTVCLLDMHNYGSYYLDMSATEQGLPGSVGTSNTRIAALWALIANRYGANPYVWFGLMNEPNKQSALDWVKTSNAIAAAIRATGSTNKIVFSGTAWDGAWKWDASGNAEQMLKAYDPANNFAFEGHQYLDSDGSGTSPICVIGSGKRLIPFTDWLVKNGLQGIIGEIGWAANPSCTAEAGALLDHWISSIGTGSKGGYIALTYWSAGPWWQDSYMYLVEPRPFPSGAEPEQLKTLKKYSIR